MVTQILQRVRLLLGQYIDLAENLKASVISHELFLSDKPVYYCYGYNISDQLTDPLLICQKFAF